MLPKYLLLHFTLQGNINSTTNGTNSEEEKPIDYLELCNFYRQHSSHYTQKQNSVTETTGKTTDKLKNHFCESKHYDLP